MSKVIDDLNEIRRAEVTAILQYMAHHDEYRNMGFEHLAGLSKRQGIEEMKHAEWLSERIFFLGGRPEYMPLKEPQSGGDIKKKLLDDIKLEEAAIERLNNAIAFLNEEKDSGSRRLLEEILDDEEEHLEELRRMFDQYENFGGAFLACICGRGAPVEPGPHKGGE